MASSDLLLHPVRFRIVRAFLGERALTTSQLAAELGDVPAGSLYRHVARLTAAGVLQVVAERRVRGSVERTYTLRLAAARIGPAEAAAMGPEDHAHAFRLFVAGLLDDFDRYLAVATPGQVAEGVAYNGGAMWLSDEEYQAFLRDLARVVQPRLANAPAPGRRRRMIYSVFLPAGEEAAPAPRRRRPSASPAAAPAPAPAPARRRAPRRG